MLLGFVVKPLARPELKSHDTRRWQNSPHLSVSLAYLRDTFLYLDAAGIRFYRMSSDLAPYVTHPDLPRFHQQVEEAEGELVQMGALAARFGLRLSFHPSQHVVLNTPDDSLFERSASDLRTQARILNTMGLDDSAVIVTHLGGVYEDRDRSRARFATNYQRLESDTRRRIVLENDDARFGVSDVLWVHERTGIRLVFDNLHHRLYNPTGMSTREALSACLATWPVQTRPKIHFSTPRTEWLVETTPDDPIPHVRRSRWNRHADYVNPFEFIDFMRLATSLREFDVMLEVRAKDLALLQLRNDIAKYAPELAGRFDDSPPATSTDSL